MESLFINFKTKRKNKNSFVIFGCLFFLYFFLFFLFCLTHQNLLVPWTIMWSVQTFGYHLVKLLPCIRTDHQEQQLECKPMDKEARRLIIQLIYVIQSLSAVSLLLWQFCNEKVRIKSKKEWQKVKMNKIKKWTLRMKRSFGIEKKEMKNKNVKKKESFIL